ENTSKSIRFDKPVVNTTCKLVDPDNVGELVDLLHNEAKVI
ncbi:MAG: electron transfer flavoprotein beta subunit/FixA family protein, partial [Flavobacteriia bacterium]